MQIRRFALTGQHNSGNFKKKTHKGVIIEIKEGIFLPEIFVP